MYYQQSSDMKSIGGEGLDQTTISLDRVPQDSLTSVAMPDLVPVMDETICFLVPSGGRTSFGPTTGGRTSFEPTMRLPVYLRVFGFQRPFIEIAKLEIERHRSLLAKLANY